MNPQPFPWHLIDRTTNASVRAVSDVHRFLASHGSAERAVARLAEVAGAPVSFRVRRASVGANQPRAGFLAVVFSFGAEPTSERMAVVVEDALAASFAARAMRRTPPRAFDASSVAPAALAGAVAAFLCSAARAGGCGPLTIRWCGPASDFTQAGLPTRVVDVSTLMLVGDDAYEAHFIVSDEVARRSPKPPFSPEILASLRDLPIPLPVLGAALVLSRDEIDALGPGDFVPLDHVTKRRIETVVVAAPECERGLRARLGDDGSLVILEGAEEIAMTAEQEAAAENAGQAPVVVRVEIGHVTMKAREWAALKPGDVVATGQKIADSIVLRVGGVEVARGELVELEGEIGVRIVSRS